MKAKLIAGAIILLPAIIVWRWYEGKYGAAKNFDPGLIQAWALSNFKAGEGSVGEGEMPYRTGKVMVLRGPIGSSVQFDYRPGFIDPAWYELPKKIRALKAEEVNTLVIVPPTKERDLSYSTTTRPAGGNFVWVYTWKSDNGAMQTVYVYDLLKQILIGSVRLSVPEDFEARGPYIAKAIEMMPER